MIELKDNKLHFTFPEIHPQAKLSIEFQRTLRIPDDGTEYPLPPGLGAFPLRHVDDFASGVPGAWLQRGGVMMPMYQSEAMWLRFHATSVANRGVYPFAIKVATGKQCAVSGDAWAQGLTRQPQNYMVAPQQPWLDGYVVEKGLIRQFVAMPLGSGYTAEEQLTGEAQHGGVQIEVYPMRRRAFEKHFQIRRRRATKELMECARFCAAPEIGLAPGGKMRQEIFEDEFDQGDWQVDTKSRCFVHLCNSMVWQSITGSPPPHPTPTAKSYSSHGLPWFDYYDDRSQAVDATDKMSELKSVAEISAEKSECVLPENESVTPENLIVYRKGLQDGQVREGAF